MRDVDELAFEPSGQSRGIMRELYDQAAEYRELVRPKEATASCATGDLTDKMQQVLQRSAGESCGATTEISAQKFLQELEKEDSVFAAKLKPLLSWVEKIRINGDAVEIDFDCEGKDKRRWNREGELAKDILTHGVVVPDVLRCRFTEKEGKTQLAGLKGLEIPTTGIGFPIKIDKVAVQGLRFSLEGNRLRLDVETKNPNPILSKLLGPDKRRPDPITSVVFVDDKGELEMYETWRDKQR